MDEIQYTTPRSFKIIYSLVGFLWFLVIGILFVHDKMYKSVPLWGIILSFSPTLLFLASFYSLRILISIENGIDLQQTWMGFQTYRRKILLKEIIKISKIHLNDGETSSYEIQISYKKNKKTKKVVFSDREIDNIDTVAKKIARYAKIEFIDEMKG